MSPTRISEHEATIPEERALAVLGEFSCEYEAGSKEWLAAVGRRILELEFQLAQKSR